MKNKTLAIYGIGTYILSVITSASDIEGNSKFPVAVILVSGIAGFIFFIMAVIRLWKQAKKVSITLASSEIILFISAVVYEITSSSYGSPVILLYNITRLIHFIAFWWAIVTLLKKPKFIGEEREQCLAYITESVTKITAFWDKESNLFNNTLVKYLDSIAENPTAANEICKAANRLVQAAQEVIHRHDSIQYIPKAALTMHYAYNTLFLRTKEWAESMLASMEALANGLQPNYEYVQKLMEKRESVQHEAYKEKEKLLKQLRLTVSGIEAFPKDVNGKLEAAK